MFKPVIDLELSDISFGGGAKRPLEIRFALSWGLEEARWGKEHPLLIFQKEGCSLSCEGTLGGGRQSWDRPSSARRVFLVGKVGTLAPNKRLLMQGKS